MLLVKAKPPVASTIFDCYWLFAKMRQDVFFARQTGQQGPWSQDPILNEYKFTNAYRASDRVSQYLIREVIYNGNWDYSDTFLRILLFKLFNKIETWQLLNRHFGEISSQSFNVDAYDKVLANARTNGTSIYSAAYIMPSGVKSKYGEISKHRFHLQLLKGLLADDFHLRLKDCQSMARGYELLLSLDGIGPFLAYQLITDLNYSDSFDFSEMDFVMPGPGALDGLRKCFRTLGEYTPADAIRWMVDAQQDHFQRLGLAFKSLWGRPLQLIDGQNLFCEVDKYCRVAHPTVTGISKRKRIKQKFKADPSPIKPFYPPKWGINHKLDLLPDD